MYKGKGDEITLACSDALKEHIEKLIKTNKDKMSAREIEEMQETIQNQQITSQSYKRLVDIHQKLGVDKSVASLLRKSTGLIFPKKPEPEVSIL